MWQSHHCMAQKKKKKKKHVNFVRCKRRFDSNPGLGNHIPKKA